MEYIYCVVENQAAIYVAHLQPLHIKTSSLELTYETINRFWTFGRTVDEKISPFKDLYTARINIEGGKDTSTLLFRRREWNSNT